MSATTNEHRDWLFGLANEWILCDDPCNDKTVAGGCWCSLILSLLADSERLADIEAVTGEDMLELADNLRKSADALENGPYVSLKTAREEYRSASDAILSLSAKVAEQEEEIALLKRQLVRFAKDAAEEAERADSAEVERDALRRGGE